MCEVLGHLSHRPSGEPGKPALPATQSRIAIAMVGVVSNRAQLRDELEARGHRFSAPRDEDLLARLIEDHDDGNLAAAVRAATRRARGSYALAAALTGSHATRLVCAGRAIPLVIGFDADRGQSTVACRALAPDAGARWVMRLREGDLAIVEAGRATVFDDNGRPTYRALERTSVQVQAPAHAIRESGQRDVLRGFFPLPVASPGRAA